MKFPADASVRDSNMNWATVLEHHADRFPDKALISFEGRVVTYSEMLDRVRRLGEGMLDLGVDRGSIVGILSRNSPEFLETILATSYIGAIAMPINTRLAPPEVAYILDDSGATALFSESQLIETAMKSIRHVSRSILRVTMDSAGSQDWIRLDDVRSRVPSPRPAAWLSGEDVQRLMYTSGTTSRPKGAMISHGNVAWKNMMHAVEFGFSRLDVGLVCGPMYHVGALDATATTMLHVAGSIVVHRSFDARAVIEEVGKGEITNIWLAPAMIRAILEVDDLERFDLSSVRVIIDGGEKMPEPLIRRLGEVFPEAWFADAYGLTEYVSADTVLEKGKTLEKIGSVGKPCIYVDIEIWDESGRPVPAGTQGEIVTRSPKVFQGYWKNEQATAEAFSGDWFHTGDVGYFDEEGYLYVVDRLKDVIVSGGENVSSLEVERVLHEHQAVVEAAVVAQPHARWGEVPCAFVVVKSGKRLEATDVIEHCRAHLAKYKIPKDVVFMDALPRGTGSRKVLKRELRKIASARAQQFDGR